MAIPAMYLALAMVLLGLLAQFSQTISIHTLGTINATNVLTADMNSATQNALGQIRTYVSNNTNYIGVTPTFTGVLALPAAPGIGTTIVQPYQLQPYASTQYGPATTTSLQWVDTIGANPLPGAQAPAGQPPQGSSFIAVYQLKVTLVNTDPSGVIETLVDTCAVRTYASAPYADINSCTPKKTDSAALSQIANDTGGQIYVANGTTTDTSGHYWEACSDTSGSGACGGYTAPMSTIPGTTTPGVDVTQINQSQTAVGGVHTGW